MSRRSRVPPRMGELLARAALEEALDPRVAPGGFDARVDLAATGFGASRRKRGPEPRSLRALQRNPPRMGSSAAGAHGQPPTGCPCARPVAVFPAASAATGLS